VRTPFKPCTDNLCDNCKLNRGRPTRTFAVEQEFKQNKKAGSKVSQKSSVKLVSALELATGKRKRAEGGSGGKVSAHAGCGDDGVDLYEIDDENYGQDDDDEDDREIENRSKLSNTGSNKNASAGGSGWLQSKSRNVNASTGVRKTSPMEINIYDDESSGKIDLLIHALLECSELCHVSLSATYDVCILLALP
jgi:hypothetical protein